MNMCITAWPLFIFLGFAHASIYSWHHVDIFEWNADPNRVALKTKRALIKGEEENDSVPRLWKVERFLHTFVGICLGYFFFWILLDKRINFFLQPFFFA
jgi:hypothetical protein